jgi:O-antigen ligase
MKKILRFGEQVFTVLSLLQYSGGPITLLLSGGANQEDVVDADYALNYILFLFIYAVTVFLLVARWKKVIYVLRKDKFIWVFMLIVVASVFWSNVPGMTLRRSITIVGPTLFGLYFATRYSLKQQLQLLGWMFGIAILLSFLFGVALPKYGVMGGIHAGAWRGIYFNKNSLGKMMVPSAIVFLLLAFNTSKNRWLIWCGFSLSVSLLLLSTSKSSLVTLIQLIAAFVAFRTLRWRYELMIPALVAIATVGASLSVLLTTNADTVLGSLGKDATLTGRTDLWPYVWEMIEKHPWLGYGYSGFWQGLNGESAYIWRATGWKPPNAHNGLLDLWLDLGLLGVAVFLFGFWTSLLKALAWARLSKTSDGLWPLIYMTFMVLANVTESTLLERNSLHWILYVAVALSILITPEQSTNVIISSESQTVAVLTNHLDKRAHKQ